MREAVRSHYADIASGLDGDPVGAACCARSRCCGALDGVETDTVGLYDAADLRSVPCKAVRASLGCGNPTAVAQLRPGEVVLDLGSGGGIDVLLSAQRVGPSGFVYGLDMTGEMLELARRNAAEVGATNVAFLKGDIAAIPLRAASVDVIISNCVVNLAADKGPVLREAYRVLRPGGRLALSDVVIHGGMPRALGDGMDFRRDLAAWAGCIAGALTDGEYRQGLAEAGFEDIRLDIGRRYGLDDVVGLAPRWVTYVGEAVAADVASRFAATTVRAVRPR